MGIFGAATSAGQLIFVQALVLWAQHLGWRGASWIIARLTLAAMVLVLFWMKDSPAQVGEQALGEPPDAAPSKVTADRGLMGWASTIWPFWRRGRWRLRAVCSRCASGKPSNQPKRRLPEQDAVYVGNGVSWGLENLVLMRVCCLIPGSE